MSEDSSTEPKYVLSEEVSRLVIKWATFGMGCVIALVSGIWFGNQIYEALPVVSWSELPSVVTPRVTAAFIVGLFVYYVGAKMALRFASWYTNPKVD